MAASDAFGAASKVAPHFSIVSLVPATVFIASSGAVVLAQPWTGMPHWDRTLAALAQPTFAQFAAMAVAVIVLALVLHPLQYPLIQLLEGFWGLSPAAVAMADTRIAHHLDALDLIQQRESRSQDELETSATLGSAASVHLKWVLLEATRLAGRYPVNRMDVMPTVLGNILRRHERIVGYPYGLKMAAVAPHLQLVGAPEDVGYVRDQRTQLDLATRMCATCALLALTWAGLLLPCGWWMLLALVPYALAHVFYRGACSVAEEYGASLATLMDLNRPALYARLGVKLPTTLKEERTQNETVERVLNRRVRADLELHWVAPPSTGAGTSTATTMSSSMQSTADPTSSPPDST